MLTTRMQKALDAGGVVNLFRVLKDWPPGELRSLVEDCEAYSQEANTAIKAAYKKAAFAPEVFFNKKASAEIYAAAKDGEMQVLLVCSEICSVALYYLEHPAKRGMKTPQL